MILILCGKSACGKDTVQKELTKMGVERIVTATTRPMRDGEIDGVDYHFMNEKDFMKEVEKGAFVEYVSYNTEIDGIPTKYYYGSKKIEGEKDACIILEPTGVKNYVNHYGELAYVIKIECSDDERKNRVIARGSFDENQWEKRNKEDEKRFSGSFDEDYVNLSIDNSGDVKETAEKIKKAFDLQKKKMKAKEKLVECNVR